MSIDWADFYNTIWAELGVPAVFTAANTAAEPIALTAIDKTSGATKGEFVQASSVQPRAAIRVAELIGAGGSLDELDDGTLEINGRIYRIESHKPMPAPTGEESGQVFLYLTEIGATDA